MYSNFLKAILLLLWFSVENALVIIPSNRLRPCNPIPSMTLYASRQEYMPAHWTTMMKKNLKHTITALLLAMFTKGTLVYAEPLSEPTTSIVSFTASDLIKSDLQPKVNLLKDIQNSLEAYPELIKQQDYLAIRQGLRQEPVVELRKTCKDLTSYLKKEEVASFTKAYDEMIDAVSSLDTAAFRRARHEGVPSGNQVDSEVLNLVDTVLSKYNAMMAVLSSYR